MKKILTLLGTITLIATSTTSLVACNTSQYSEEELKIWKQNNKINTDNEEIKDNLESIASQEKPFITVDNKYYFVVWRGDKSDDWKIVKFKHFEQKEKVLDKYDKYKLKTSHFGGDLFIYKNGFVSYDWNKDGGIYFKSVYRWNNDEQKLPNLCIDEKGSIKINTQ